MYSSSILKLYFWIGILGAIGAAALFLFREFFNLDVIRLVGRNIELQIFLVSLFAAIFAAFTGNAVLPSLKKRNRKEPEDLISREVEKEIVKDKVSELVDIFHVLRIRLLIESERLKFTSNKNLTIGIFFSSLAFGMLAYFVLAYQAALDPTKDYLEFLSKWFLPRLAIVALVQFVGFFFLRLYVANELDIKHNKNELTNVELKLMAYAIAKSRPSPQAVIVIEELAKSERNFILKKNEKTLSHENLSEFNDLRDVVQRLADKIPSRK